MKNSIDGMCDAMEAGYSIKLKPKKIKKSKKYQTKPKNHDKIRNVKAKRLILSQ
tara:strand:- start:681 stop:842 length:162 start_codon:yes stop_codon:yes gene_type:complete